MTNLSLSINNKEEEEMSDENPSAQEWLSGLATELGLDSPTSEEIESLLNLAGVAAHLSLIHI